MTYNVNLGPSMSLLLQPPRQLNGFASRFVLQQNDPRFTPGRAEPRLPSETTKGTTKTKKSNRKAKKVNNQKLTGMITNKPKAIYGGFGNVKPVRRKRGK